MSYGLGGFSVTASTSQVMLIIFAIYSVVIVGFGFYIKYQSKKGGKDGLAPFLTGGGGLGAMALHRGFPRHQNIVLWGAVILLVILVQIFQTVGTRFAVGLDRRLSDKGSRKHGRKETAKKIKKDRRIPGAM